VHYFFEKKEALKPPPIMHKMVCFVSSNGVGGMVPEAAGRVKDDLALRLIKKRAMPFEGIALYPTSQLTPPI